MTIGTTIQSFQMISNLFILSKQISILQFFSYLSPLTIYFTESKKLTDPIISILLMITDCTLFVNRKTVKIQLFLRPKCVSGRPLPLRLYLMDKRCYNTIIVYFSEISVQYVNDCFFFSLRTVG